jgi:hypothetical protein
MKRINKLSFIGLSFLFVFASCKNDGFYYKDEARVRLKAPYEWALGTDSMDFSFVKYPESVTEYNLPVTIFIMGNPANHARTVNLAFNEAKTTAQEKHYAFPAQVVLPADSFRVIFPVCLKRTADLQEKGVCLYLQILESSDFKIGASEENHLLIKWSDILTRPANWNELVEFFGTFSIIKYRFIIETTGITEFSAQTMSWAMLTNYRIMCVNALNDYNEAHPGNPLKDENGQYVTF